ncbi:MAG: HyaD/HybD family hydrogenase maturation endopeptidase [Deltaproteobacteria bacterium]|nr:HyaD/HybD family hydrogenase maturation endopeptidase [Deltaproteobacteria bacterium]
MNGGRGKKKILVLGVGNVLLSDEGLGVRAVERLAADYSIPPSVSLVDGGTGGLNLLPVIKGRAYVIIIDAIRGGQRPGAVYRLGAEKFSAARRPLSSLHGLGVKELLEAASLEGKLPGTIVLGMEPFDISPGLGLSPLIESRLPALIKSVEGELLKSGVRLKRKQRRGV